MACLVSEMVVKTHKDDVWATRLNNKCCMCERNLQRIGVNEITKMIASWSW
jgi:hypothetical protein